MRKKLDMKRHVFICDGCEKRIEERANVPYPEGWMDFLIYSGPRMAVAHEDGIHVCSSSCAEKAGGKFARSLFNELRSRR